MFLSKSERVRKLHCREMLLKMFLQTSVLPGPWGSLGAASSLHRPASAHPFQPTHKPSAPGNAVQSGLWIGEEAYHIHMTPQSKDLAKRVQAWEQGAESLVLSRAETRKALLQYEAPTGDQMEVLGTHCPMPPSDAGPRRQLKKGQENQGGQRKSDSLGPPEAGLTHPRLRWTPV